VQDIAGCRMVVRGAVEQDNAIDTLIEVFPQAVLHDRRKSPSHGYRAVHLIVRALGLPVEIQIRTRLQHGWAEISERLSDRHGAALKYGGGDPAMRELLLRTSAAVEVIEDRELELDGSTEAWSHTLELRENLLSTLALMSDQLSQE
jgi:putative GTP pyrophosphokinase